MCSSYSDVFCVCVCVFFVFFLGGWFVVFNLKEICHIQFEMHVQSSSVFL